jgi:hypothetical protein
MIKYIQTKKAKYSKLLKIKHNRKIMFYRVLRFVFLVLTCGFYTMHVAAYEIPIEPRTPEKMQEESDRNNPGNEYERKALDQIDPDNAPHSEEDRKNWASPFRDD